MAWLDRLGISGLFILFATVTLSDCTVLYPFKVDTVLNDTYKIAINWNLNFEQRIANFAIEIENSGKKFQWFAFGFSDEGEFPGSDVCVFHKNKVTDAYIDEIGALRRDYQQDCNNAKIIRMPDGRLVFLFTRQFNTCDRRDVPIDPGTTLLVVAVGQTFRKNVFGQKVAKKILPNRVLRSPQPKPEVNDSQVKSVVAGAQNIEIPAQETTYWCTVVLLPQMTQKNHIIKYEAAIEPGNEKYVHHMEVYHCESPDGGNRMPKFNGPCTEHDRPEVLKSCRKVLAAWAMGAEPFVYPKEAGIPIGGSGYFPFVMIETHYNNQDLQKGVMDSSGIRLYYTPNLRKYDAGILETGLIYTDDMAIPPGQTAFPLSGYCAPECSEAGLPNEGMVIFASQLHDHLAGHKLWTAHVREGIDLGDVNRDEHFVTHFQEIRHLATPVKILPGDALITTCVYNTNKRTNVTLGGLGINDEMCVNYIHYYPKTRLEVCKSSVERAALAEYFDLMNRFESQKTDPLKPTAENYRSIVWNGHRSDELGTFYKTSPIRMECLQNDGIPFPGVNWESMEKPEIMYRFLEPKKTECD